MLLKYFAASYAVLAFMLSLPIANADINVAHKVNGYGNLFPTLINDSLASSRNSLDPPWYVTFDLTQRANVDIGVLGLTDSSGNAFHLTSTRLVTVAGADVADGTNIVPVNPFPEPITQLIVAHDVPIGSYAIEVSGSGDSILTADFITRVNVNFVPEPEIYALMLIGIGATGYAMRKRTRRQSELGK